MFDFSIITSWVHGLLTSLMPLGLAVFIECVIVGGCLLLMYTVIAILMIFMERKVCAAFQCRLGPMRVGPWGTVQVICDVFKMLTKEIITIRRSDKFLYNQMCIRDRVIIAAHWRSDIDPVPESVSRSIVTWSERSLKRL